MKSVSLLLSLLVLHDASFSAEPVATRETPPYVPPVPKAGARANVQNVTPAEAEKLLAERKDLVVLDVRTPEEFEKGHLPGAKNVDFLGAQFAKNAAAFAGKPIVVHCAAGNRSAKALPLLDQKTFPQIYHLSGGYAAWTAAGKPVVSETKLR